MWDGTDSREHPDVVVMQHEVRIQKEQLTALESDRLVDLFGEWAYENESPWTFSVIDGNNYIQLKSTCPGIFFTKFIDMVVYHVFGQS